MQRFDTVVISSVISVNTSGTVALMISDFDIHSSSSTSARVERELIAEILPCKSD